MDKREEDQDVPLLGRQDSYDAVQEHKGSDHPSHAGPLPHCGLQPFLNSHKAVVFFLAAYDKHQEIVLKISIPRPPSKPLKSEGLGWDQALVFFKLLVISTCIQDWGQLSGRGQSAPQLAGVTVRQTQGDRRVMNGIEPSLPQALQLFGINKQSGETRNRFFQPCYENKGLAIIA